MRLLYISFIVKQTYQWSTEIQISSMCYSQTASSLVFRHEGESEGEFWSERKHHDGFCLNFKGSSGGFHKSACRNTTQLIWSEIKVTSAHINFEIFQKRQMIRSWLHAEMHYKIIQKFHSYHAHIYHLIIYLIPIWIHTYTYIYIYTGIDAFVYICMYLFISIFYVVT